TMSTYRVPPPDGAARWAKYRLRFEREAGGRLPDGSSETMAKLIKEPALIARVQASMDGLHAVETEARTVLCTAGVPPMMFVFYLDFARELWKLTNRVSGDSATGEAAALAAKWLVRGLASEVLRKICYQVFSIRLPAGE
ncbi:MAG: hypothetical protein R6X12_07245, partial [bacterium]